MIKCKFCDKEYSIKGIATHIWRTHGDGINHDPNINYVDGDRRAWNKGLTKITDDRVLKNAISIKKTINAKIKNGTFVPSRMSLEQRQKLGLLQSIKNRGGKCKWYEVSGQKVQGTWERNIALKLDELKIKWYKPKVNKDVWMYKIDGVDKPYTPDLFLPEFNVFLEIKGYWWGNDKEKMKCVLEQHNDKKLVIITKKEYERILQGELVWSFQQ